MKVLELDRRHRSLEAKWMTHIDRSSMNRLRQFLQRDADRLSSLVTTNVARAYFGKQSKELGTSFGASCASDPSLQRTFGSEVIVNQISDLLSPVGAS